MNKDETIMQNQGRLKLATADEVINLPRQPVVDRQTLQQVEVWMEMVRHGGTGVLRELIEKYDHRGSYEKMIFSPADFSAAKKKLLPDRLRLLQDTADRIRSFAFAQRGTLKDLEMDVAGGRAGHCLEPLAIAGCYVPGGRYELVSSLLMTAVTARAAGVETVWVACPRPTETILAAAAIAEVDGLLAAGGAHAIAALTFGIDAVPACDVIAGPGNRWVTAAKHVASRWTKIDMLAGPSELLVIADNSANPVWVAADLLAQAEHDPQARPILISLSHDVVDRVNAEIFRQLANLSTAEVATAALQNGFAIVASDDADVTQLVDCIAPEHLAIHCEEAKARELATKVRRCGTVFIGGNAGEVFGDYGAGPNHVLPTGGSARSTSGLSVATFLRWRTWLAIDDLPTASAITRDAQQLAQLEGLPAHAFSAQVRLPSATPNQ